MQLLFDKALTRQNLVKRKII